MENEISAKELKEKLNNLFTIDVREPDEYPEGTIQKSLQVPLGKLIRDVGRGVIQLPRDKEIVTFCAGGFRGDIAAKFLQQKGFKAKNLVGGFKAWREV